MRKTIILCSLSLLVLAGCNAKIDTSDADANSSDGNVHIAMGDAAGGDGNVSVNAPGFKASVSLPNINLAGHMDLDGIKLAPNSHVNGLNVDAQDNGKTQTGSHTKRLLVIAFRQTRDCACPTSASIVGLQ